MRFLMFAGGEFEGKPELQDSGNQPLASFLRDKFSLDDDAVQVILYALAFCVSEEGAYRVLSSPNTVLRAAFQTKL